MHDLPHRLSLLARITSTLDRAGSRYALIGASAMAAHGVSRSTHDQDLLVVDARCLTPSLWTDLQSEGIEVEVRKGDLMDPLAGVVRFDAPGQRSVDLVVGKLAWQGRALERAERLPLGEMDIPVVGVVDLILLKLYAGGPQDAWDIEQLLLADPGRSSDVDREIGQIQMPSDSKALWKRILAQR